MANEKIKRETERAQKGNSSDTLLAIYVLRVLKKYSSSENALSVQQVLKHLREDHSIGIDENEDAQRKKIRRYLDTLCESYFKGCIVKREGVKRDGYKWYYDASRDAFANDDGQVRETLTDIELELIIDLISATKILNADSTLGMIEKLLKKTSLSDEDVDRRLASAKKERWTKNINEYLVESKELIQGYIDLGCNIGFLYECNNFVVATPCGWEYVDGKCYLKAKVGGKQRQFLLDKIHEVEESDGSSDNEYEYDCEDNLSNNTSLESLFSNIPFIKNAIKERLGIKFYYRSYAVRNNRVVLEDNAKNVLPHSLVFNDGKYYLIGIDQDAVDINKVCYFRVDLIADLEPSETRITLSEWNKQVYDTIQRAREVEKHPLMVAGQEIDVQFLAMEYALDRVIDAFGTSPRFQGTMERVILPTGKCEQKNQSDEDLPREKAVKFTVRTTREEAFRWALANADAVELVSPQDLRDRLARISDPMYQIYTHTLSDKVRENIDVVLKEGKFGIDNNVDENTAYETYKELSRMGQLGAVRYIRIWTFEFELPIDYLGDFINAVHLDISMAPIEDFSWASRLVNIENIHLHDIDIDDVSWMSNMKNLRMVCLPDCPVADLSVLSEHRNIHWLDISGTKITDISFIEKFEKLQLLNIVICPIEDYSPLLTLPSRLETLEIDEKALAEIGKENIKKRHYAVTILPRKNSTFWRFLI